MTKKNSLTFTLASSVYGYGHYKRMLNFKNSLLRNNIRNDLIYFQNKNIFINKKKISFKFIKSYILKKNIHFFVFDFSNPKFMNENFFINLIDMISSFKLPVIIFDDFSKNILSNLKLFSKHILVCPYIYDEKFIKLKKKKYPNLLIGPKFAVLEQATKIKKKNTKLEKVMISCGGTDFKKLTIKLIQILKDFKNLKICAIIGPHFDHKEKDKIYKLKHKNLKILNNVDSIADIAKNYDLAIITSGLTKYELLGIRKKFAVISENKEFHKFHLPFSKKKLCYNLGYYKNFKKLKTNVKKLVNEYKNFEKSVNYKNIDTNGADRIIKIIKNNF